MKQIVPNLHVFDETGEMVHCYLWEWPGGLTLIDTGMPGSGETIAKVLVANGHPLHQVKRIIITHADIDHMGAAAALKRATGAVVACHGVEKQLLEHPGRRGPAKLWLRPLFALARLVPSFRVQAVAPDELLVDGTELPEGFTVVHTPGHTPGHISLLHRGRRLLIAGDALNNRSGKLRPPPSYFTPDMKNAQRSVWKLAKKYGDEIDVAVFGHGEPVLNNAGARIKALASTIFSAET
jgi:glyoxylase-like metal-dependent hydrolase (beta-lactamase superfamily II)